MASSSPTTAAAQARPFPLHTGVAEVVSVQRITPRMARIVLGGDAVAGFPDDQPGEILTLIWAADGHDAPVLPLPDGGWRFPPDAPEQHARNYTIRHYDRETPAITIDVVLHGDHGTASRWALNATPGDTIGFAGPRTHFVPEADADYTLLAGDETALPAIAATLERLPAGHPAIAFVEVEDATEEQDLPGVVWVHRDGTPAGRSTALLDAIKTYTLPSGTPKVWCAGESLVVRGLREHLRDERGFAIGPLQAIGYWKHRDTPDDVDSDES